MAEPLSAAAALAALRAEGCRVEQYRDWRTHNRGTGWGPLNGVMLHHTVTEGTAGTVRLCYEGYASLPGPLCHGVIGKDGVIYLVGWGRANHAGLGDDEVLRAVIAERSHLPEPNERNTDGNSRFYGFECENLGDGEDPWPDEQLECIERASAALCRAHGWKAESVLAHKGWSYTKIDPRGFSMDEMRSRIADRLDRPPGEDDDMPISNDDVKRIAAAAAEATINYDGIEPPHPAEGNPAHQLENAFTSMWKAVDRTERRLDEVADVLSGLDVAGLREMLESARLRIDVPDGSGS